MHFGAEISLHVTCNRVRDVLTRRREVAFVTCLSVSNNEEEISSVFQGFLKSWRMLELLLIFERAVCLVPRVPFFQMFV
jgi:hypothetical protein